MDEKTSESATAPRSNLSAKEIPDLVARMRRGERRAIAAAVTELEKLSQAAPALLEAFQPHLGHALVVGFTGPPGAGKSTLVNAVIQHARRANRTVGVIAVDPSSPISGGAILGDRIRMTAALDDDGVFVRSLASRGYLGGLSPAAVRVIDALDAAGFDLVLLETVGTGQSEMDVAEVADVRVVITAPGLGDDIQAMKSGLLEIADVLVVNKGDREGAEMTSAAADRRALHPLDARQGAGAQDDGDHRRRRAGARHDRRRHRQRRGRRQDLSLAAGGAPATSLRAQQPTSLLSASRTARGGP